MTTYIVQYKGMANLRSGNERFPAPQEPGSALVVTTAAGSTAASTTIALAAGTNLISMFSTLNTYWVFGSTSLTSTQVTSTNVRLVQPGVTWFFGVPPNTVMIGFST